MKEELELRSSLLNRSLTNFVFLLWNSKEYEMLRNIIKKQYKVMHELQRLQKLSVVYVCVTSSEDTLQPCSRIFYRG